MFIWIIPNWPVLAKLSHTSLAAVQHSCFPSMGGVLQPTSPIRQLEPGKRLLHTLPDGIEAHIAYMSHGSDGQRPSVTTKPTRWVIMLLTQCEPARPIPRRRTFQEPCHFRNVFCFLFVSREDVSIYPRCSGLFNVFRVQTCFLIEQNSVQVYTTRMIIILQTLQILKTKLLTIDQNVKLFYQRDA